MATDAAELLEGQDVEALEAEQEEVLSSSSGAGQAAEAEAEAADSPTLDASSSDGGPPPVEAEPTEPTEPTEPDLDLTQRLLDLGFKDVDDSSGPGRLLETYEHQQQQLETLQQQIAQMQPLVQYGHQHLAALQSSSGGGQPGASQPVAEPEPSESWWSPPQFDANWMERYREPDPTSTGQFRWKENTPAEVMANTQSYQQYIQDWADNLTSRPQEVLPPIIEQVVVPLFEKMYEERRNQETSGSFIEGLRESNDWLYERDPRTNEATNKLSAEGQQAMEWASEAQEMGISDTRQQWQYVETQRELASLRANQTQSQKQETVQGKRAAQRSKDRQQGVHSSEKNLRSAGGSATEAGQAQNTKKSAGWQLVDALIEDGAQFN